MHYGRIKVLQVCRNQIRDKETDDRHQPLIVVVDALRHEINREIVGGRIGGRGGSDELEGKN